MSISITPAQADELMKLALVQARLAVEKREVPVGAVVWAEGKIIAEAHNLTEANHDATAHAEILAIKKASEVIKNWRLTSAVLCVTLEPCSMCIGAMRLARIPTIIYGASDPRMGAVGSLFDLSQDKRLGEIPRVISGVMGKECAKLLEEFFLQRREKK